MTSLESKPDIFGEPLWNVPGVVKSESLLSIRERPASAAEVKLFFSPKKTLHLYHANRTKPGNCRQVEFESTTLCMQLGLMAAGLFPEPAYDRTVERLPNGKLFPFFRGILFHDLQVCVDYEAEQLWKDPVPVGHL